MNGLWLRTAPMKRYALTYRVRCKPRQGPYWILQENKERKKLREIRRKNQCQ